MKVLSLFDGISCGRAALERAGIPVEKYTAYEIDKYAVKVSEKNYPDIEHCGNVFDGNYTQYKGYDLLLGGSPCTYWSIAKKNRETKPDGEGFKLFMQYVRALRESQCRWFLYENIHVGAENHTPKTLRNLVNIMASKQDILYNALKINHERRAYCKKLESSLIERINNIKPDSRSGLENIWYEGYLGTRDAHYNSSRYHGLNLHATFTKGTVEFRLFNSTTHAGKIKAYIQLCLAINHQALVQKYASPKPTVSDNECYTFRTWLLRLGLIGDEFKTARHHLLANLEGNIAWRHSA